MPNLDRFGVGRRDPQDVPESAYHCQDCDEVMEIGAAAWELCGGIWCSDRCFARSVGTLIKVGEHDV
ncbi:hypothetical protein [Paenibacillus sp. FJAT-26967]|uniref:hypothetical protein n=1 Tax=Paenibacillus sp. FJAT-26967 TaxID=1729690 RepID=UPI000839354E|nr:hypothetical protein [Paenibacillus sp. FJAT-26967]